MNYTGDGGLGAAMANSSRDDKIKALEARVAELEAYVTQQKLDAFHSELFQRVQTDHRNGVPEQAIGRRIQRARDAGSMDAYLSEGEKAEFLAEIMALRDRFVK